MMPRQWCAAVTYRLIGSGRSASRSTTAKHIVDPSRRQAVATPDPCSSASSAWSINRPRAACMPVPLVLACRIVRRGEGRLRAVATERSAGCEPRASVVKRAARPGGRARWVKKLAVTRLERQPVPGGNQTMDLLALLAQLDDTIHNAKPAPLSGHAMIDKDKVGEILDQMRATIPEENRQAPWIVQDSKERLAAAERMLEEAREAGASSSLAGAAAEQVRGIIEAAERTAADIRSNVERDAREAQRAAEETRRDAEQRATEAGDRAAAEAAALLGQAEEAIATTLERARGVESELDGLVGNLHASIGSLVERVGDGAGSLSTHLEQ